jgi:creatinine amidohydrolase
MQYGEYKWTEIEDLTGRVAVVPLGSLEQHGRHLPLLTDSLVGAEIVRRAEQALGDTAVFLPMLWLGASDHHRRFPGTISIGIDTYTHVVSDVMESLVGSGFRRVFVLNCHGGNKLPGERAIYDVTMRHRDDPALWLVFGTWYELAAPQIAEIDTLDQRRVSHASELETSLVLALRGDLVDLAAARGASIALDSDFYCPDMHLGSRVAVYPPLERLSATGSVGHPERATPEKGEAILTVAVDQVVACVRDIARWPWLDPERSDLYK